MRTTLTLDDDVAANLKTESQRAGRPFQEIVNETLRRGLACRRATGRRRALKVTAPTSAISNPDNIAKLIEHVEGSLHR